MSQHEKEKENHGQKYCSSCKGMRPITEFSTRVAGSVKKTCNKHNRTRPIRTTQLATFLDLLKDYKNNKQSGHLHCDVVIKYEDLSTPFERISDDSEPSEMMSLIIPRIGTYNDSKPYNEAFTMLELAIWEYSGYSFVKRNASLSPGKFTATYFCRHSSQSAQRALQEKNERANESLSYNKYSVNRFPCRGGMTLQFYPDRLRIQIHHEMHHDVLLTAKGRRAMVKLVNETENRVPIKIMTKRLTDSLERAGDSSHPTCRMVEHMPDTLHTLPWKIDSDPWIAAQMLVRNSPNHILKTFTVNHYKAIGIFCKTRIDRCGSRIEELVIDSKFNATSMKCEFFAVAGAYKQATCPVSFLLVATINDGSHANMPGSKTELLRQYFSAVDTFLPGVKFVFTEGDAAQLAAGAEVWPDKRQLCQYHAYSTIKEKMLVSRRANDSSLNYQPMTVQQYFTSSSVQFEPCFGSHESHRTGPHRDGTCDCRYKIGGEQENNQHSLADFDDLRRLFERHINMHVATVENRVSATPEAIHKYALEKMYEHCYQRGKGKLWAYMYTVWYCEERFKLVGKSAESRYRSTLKTINMVKNLWGNLKKMD